MSDLGEGGISFQKYVRKESYVKCIDNRPYLKLPKTAQGVKAMGKNYGGTISTFEFFQRFPNEQAAIDAIESRRWEDGVVCPYCEGEKTTRMSGSNSPVQQQRVPQAVHGQNWHNH